MRETIVMLEIQRIEMTSHQSTIQHLLHCITSKEFKMRVFTHIKIQLQKKKKLHYGTIEQVEIYKIIVLYNYFLSFIIFMNLCHFSSFNNSSYEREIELILRSNFKGA
jgi:hypothetical protein